jgi:hypothetical protein
MNSQANGSQRLPENDSQNSEQGAAEITSPKYEGVGDEAGSEGPRTLLSLRGGMLFQNFEQLPTSTKPNTPKSN